MIKVADEIWIATALLHKEHPERQDFTTAEIIERALKENLAGYRQGLAAHASGHCVATKPPSPARLRMLTETARGRRRLFREGDAYNAERKGGKTRPDRSDIPQKYTSLIDWYEEDYSRGNGNRENPATTAARPHGRDLLKFVGSIPADDLKRMSEAIEEGCERVDLNEW